VHLLLRACCHVHPAQVYWEMQGGVRCCRPCLEARTMSDYRLTVGAMAAGAVNDQ